MGLLRGNRAWGRALDCVDVRSASLCGLEALFAPKSLGLTCMEHLCRGSRNSHEQSLGVSVEDSPAACKFVERRSEALRGIARVRDAEWREGGGSSECEGEDEYVSRSEGGWKSEIGAVGSTCMEGNGQAAVGRSTGGRLWGRRCTVACYLPGSPPKLDPRLASDRVGRGVGASEQRLARCCVYISPSTV